MHARFTFAVPLLALAVASASFGASPVYVRSIGGQGTAPGLLQLPTGVAIDAAGDVYVSDSENCRVTRFRSDGTYVTHWNACGAQSGQASGIAVDANGTVFVALRHGVLAMFDADGTPLGQVTHDNLGDRLSEPRGLEAMEEGVYLTDYGTSKIYRWDLGGLAPIASGRGCGPGEFWGPVSVARAGGRLFVTEYSDRLQELTEQGGFVAELGSTASCGQVRGYPRAVCALGADRLVVLDALHNSAEIITTGGTLIAAWGGQGSGPDQLYGPFDVATDAQGRIYIADAWNGRIQVYDSGPTPARPTTWGRLKTIYR